ncbi:Polyketide cyclase [uncultured Pleomorphomonas sp.]|uniref:Polyketide cyclase n=1 Tax=uncultured Pleomorphomonas sp. TaxID=442121 RepID=A0A212LCN1_9HYPH|nr:nuclear transport factor 2 family protein [uncultured Pleomorphomonas sp.]SCM75295.1 Polyketide cyclase [uncultured Pleomorphomonas sp.]
MINLPAPIAAYFTADLKDGDAVARCFTDTAVVKDEGQTYTGREAIQAWKIDVSARYSYVSEPRAIAVEGDRTVVTSRLTGNFPGSPVDLRFLFLLDGDRIAALEITP